MSVNNDIAVRVGADVTSLKQGMKDGSKSVGMFSDKSAKDLGRAAANIAKVGAAAIAAGAAMVAGLYVKGAKVVDQQAKLARSMNSSVVSMQALDRAADLAGISQDGLANAAGKLNARLGEAMRGTGQAALMLDRLGMSASELADMEADERLAAIADRMRDLGYNSAQAGDALKQFGVREEEIVGLMLEGGDAFRAARQEVIDFGLAVSDVDAAQIEAANDAMTAIGVTVQGVANRVAIELSPYVLEVAGRFADASKEADGFGSQVDTAIATSLRGLGMIADGLHYVRVGFKTLVLAGHAFNAAMASVTLGILEAFTFLRDGAADIVNQIIEAVNKIPGVDIATVDPFTDSAFMQGMRAMAADANQTVADVYNELGELATRELPSAKINEFLAAVAARSQEAAQAVVDARREMLGGGGGDGDDPEMSDGEKAAMDTKLQALKDRLLQEHELLQQKYQQDMELLNQALAAQRLTEGEHHSLAQSLLLTHQQKMTQIESDAAEQRKRIADAEADAKRQIIGNALTDLTTLMNTGSRKLFEIGKAAAIGNAIINTHEGITAALKLPFPYNLAAAAATAAKGFASVSAIRSQSFGGGGAGARATGSNTAAVNAGTTPVSTNTGSSGAQQNTVINLSGDFFGETQIRGLIERINETTRNGGRIILK